MVGVAARLPDRERAGRVAVALCGLFVLLVAVQFAATSVGATTAAGWSSPETLAAPNGSVTALAASNGRDASVAWVDTVDGRATVRVADLRTANGTVRAGSPSTLSSTDAGVDTVAVAGSFAVWDEHDTNTVVLAGPNGSRNVSTAIRVRNPTVAVIGGTPVTAWAAFRNGSYDLRVHTARGSAWVNAGPTGRGSPTLVGGGDRGYLVWREASNRTALAAPVRLTSSGPVVGRARALGPAFATGGFGPSAAGAIDAARVPGGVRAVWTNQRVVTTAAFANDSVSDTETYGPGQRPRIASTDSSWTAAWLTESRSTGYDVAVRSGAGGTEAAVALPGDSLAPTPAFAPERSLVWVERTGNNTRVLGSAAHPTSRPAVVGRLAAAPGRFAFVALAAGALGLVTFPLLPWTVVSVLFAFLASTRAVSGRALALAARLTGRTTADWRETASSVDGIYGFLIYAVLDVVVLRATLPATAALPFTHPYGVTAVALAGTLAARRALGVRGFWQYVAAFGYIQTALLWATALPTFL